MWTVIIAHIMFCISFVVVTVRARVAEPRPLARGGGAGSLRLAVAGVLADHLPAAACRASLAAALLCFALSFDDFIITNFVSGGAETFPKFVYIAAARGIPPQANVIASFVFFLAIILVVATQLAAGARRRRLAKRG